jgi:hypothetical protein
MSPTGHSLQIVGRRKSLHVRNAPKATVGRQSVVRRDGPIRDMVKVDDPDTLNKTALHNYDPGASAEPPLRDDLRRIIWLLTKVVNDGAAGLQGLGPLQRRLFPAVFALMLAPRRLLGFCGARGSICRHSPGAY